jgi:hypothetical protein
MQLREALGELPETVFADLLESDEAYLLVIDLPGATSETVDVRLENGRLRIEARRDKDVPRAFRYVTEERSPFLDAELPLPSAVTGGGAEADAEKVNLAETLDNELAQIRALAGDDPSTEEVEIDEGRFGITGSFGRLARILPREMEPSDLKQLRAATQNALSLIIRDRSGAQASGREVARLESFAGLSPGDGAETIRTKLMRRQRIVDRYKQTGDANAAVDSIMQGGGGTSGQSEQDILDEVYGGGI